MPQWFCWLIPHRRWNLQNMCLFSKSEIKSYSWRWYDRQRHLIYPPPPHYPYYPVLHSLRHHVSVDVYRLSVGGGGGGRNLLPSEAPTGIIISSSSNSRGACGSSLQIYHKSAQTPSHVIHSGLWFSFMILVS